MCEKEQAKDIWENLYEFVLIEEDGSHGSAENFASMRKDSLEVKSS